MAHWKANHEKRLREILRKNNCIAKFIGVGNNGTTTSNVFYYQEQPDIIIGYNENKKIYYIWNAYLHNTLSYLSNTRVINDKSKILVCYEALKDGKQNYEKKLIVPENMIDCFCTHWHELLVPYSCDDGYFNGINVLWADRENSTPSIWSEIISDVNEETYRKRVTTERYERDKSFRNLILEDYGSRCAVCYCSIKEILEAHHINYVADNGSDNIQNGICLCRNHHEMVHAGIIKFNPYITEYEVNKEVIEDISIKYAIDKYEGKLIIPISRRKQKVKPAPLKSGTGNNPSGTACHLPFQGRR